MNLQALFIAIVIAFAAGNYSGWTIKTYKTDSENLAAKEAIKDTEQAISGILETKLQSISANQRTIIREVPKIIERPVYYNLCLDPDGMRLANAAKSGTAEFAGEVH